MYKTCIYMHELPVTPGAQWDAAAGAGVLQPLAAPAPEPTRRSSAPAKGGLEVRDACAELRELACSY